MKKVTKVLYPLILCAFLVISLPLNLVSATACETGIRTASDQTALIQGEDTDTPSRQDTQEEAEKENNPPLKSATPNEQGDDF